MCGIGCQWTVIDKDKEKREDCVPGCQTVVRYLLFSLSFDSHAFPCLSVSPLPTIAPSGCSGQAHVVESTSATRHHFCLSLDFHSQPLLLVTRLKSSFAPF